MFRMTQTHICNVFGFQGCNDNGTYTVLFLFYFYLYMLLWCLIIAKLNLKCKCFVIFQKPHCMTSKLHYRFSSKRGTYAAQQL